MNDHTSQFLTRLKGIALSANERLQMRERLAAYADMHPAIEAATPAFGGFFSFMGTRRFSTYATALLLVAVLGSGVALAADASVPGDSLYAVKINVNEPLMTAFAATPAGQAKVAANIATRRVDEAVTLASRHELTADKEQYLSAQFDERVKIAAKKADELAMLDSSAATDVKENLAANLAGEAQALGAVSADDTGDAKNALLNTVVATSESISDSASSVNIAVTDSESASGDEASTSARAKGASVHIEHASGFFSASTSATTSPSLRDFATGRFSRHLRVASTTLRTASSTLSTGSLLLPRLDVAIPAAPAQPEGISGDDSGEVHLGD